MNKSLLHGLWLFIMIHIHKTNAQNDSTTTTEISTTYFNDTECDAEATCLGKGKCIVGATSKDDLCDCDNGWTTHNPKISGTECNYEQKSQLVAFLLSFFLGGVGAGRFYCELWATAAIKLCIMVVGCCCIVVLGFFRDSDYSNIGTAAACCVYLASMGWWLADVILFGINDIQDGNGVDLYPW